MFAKVSLPSICLLFSLAVARAQDVAAYVDIQTSSLPIILTAPHGGTLKPSGIKDRTLGKTVTDSNTAQLTDLIAAALKEQYGARPHVVKCLLHRSKVDCNRDLEEAAQGDPIAAATWRRFHGAAEQMRKHVLTQHGAGLLLDIHGHRHEERRVELGYLIAGPRLNQSDEALNGNRAIALDSSIRELDLRSPQSFTELLRGPQSLGALLEERGFRSVPSPSRRGPGVAQYFSGSYTVTAHGSRDEGAISAIQVECPWDGVRDKPENQRRFAKALAEALGLYFKVHFGKNLGAN
ncbi:MAG TPA: hypothetical protein VD994_21035 [Prosthecobacter sp.]|nr:hypothetical protein [Prosthecobacter sp.]